MEEHLAQALRAMRALVVGSEPLRDTLQQVSEHAVRGLAADMAGLTLRYPDGRARTAAWTADAAVEVDEAQYEADDGPCLEAFRTCTVVRLGDIAADPRWPAFRVAAATHGVGSSLSLPLVLAGDGLGALNLYSSAVHHFGPEHEEAGAVFAAEATVVLVNAQAYWDQASRAENLAAAMQTRAVIEQAKGIIMATTGRTADAAFELLRVQSQTENRKLHEIAEELVDRHQRRAESSPS